MNWEHHAYLIYGGEPALEPRETLRFETLGIDDARGLKARQQLAVPVGERHIFLVVCGAITPEAQNALLKTLEEPNPQVCFVFALPDRGNLLPTLLSRCQEVWLEAKSQKLEARFFEAPPEERLKIVSEVEDRRAALDFLAGLERTVPKRPNRATLEALATARRYLELPNAMPKLILEHLALTLP